MKFREVSFPRSHSPLTWPGWSAGPTVYTEWFNQFLGWHPSHICGQDIQQSRQGQKCGVSNKNRICAKICLWQSKLYTLPKRHVLFPLFGFSIKPGTLSRSNVCGDYSLKQWPEQGRPPRWCIWVLAPQKMVFACVWTSHQYGQGEHM